MILKAYKKPAGYRLAILSILLLIIGAGCSLTRGIHKDQTLVRKITLKGIDEEFSETALNYVDKEQQPNNKLNLQFYYWFSNNGKRNIGEAPALLDSNLVEYSRLQMEKFIQNRGYLKAKVTDSIIIKKQRAELVFTATEGPMFRIRKVTDSIPDKKVANLYVSNRNKMSHIQPGGRFDNDSLAHDRDEIYLLLKRNGYYDFYRQYINFTYDSTFNSSVVDVKMTIDNPAGKTEHPVYQINKTLITIAASNGKTAGKADTIKVDSQFTYVDFSKRFRPRVVTDYTFQKKGQLYDIDKQSLTTTRLSELNVFRNVPNPTYQKLPDSTHRLDTKIDIIPLKHYSDRVEGEFLFANGRYGYNVGNTFTDRNLFKQAAILQLKVNWSILFDNGSNTTSNDNIQNQELRLGVNLIYPRIISPFNFPVLGKHGVPHTTFSTNYSLFYQKGLVTRESFVNSISYDFYETARKQHTITPINIEFSKGVIDSAAKANLLAFNRQGYINLIGRTVFTTGSQYTFQYNAIELNTYDNFLYFRGSLDIGGNFLSLLSNTFNTPKDATTGKRTLFGYTFSQYTKVDGDIRFYRTLGGEKQFVFRIAPGIGVPYGNSNELIFEKNFYAGGANDMRAWLPRTLGPGNFNRATYYGTDTTGRTRYKYLDQFGEIKLVANAEYRYKLVNNFFGAKLKGAVFVDAGNVWRLGNKTESPGGEFKFDNLWQSTAIGIGTGLRFDLSFFVFRLDMAFKFKDPQFNGSDQWVLIKHADELFKSGSFKEAYLKANATGVDKNGNVVGDGYNFMQLNFGIGLPF